MRYLILLTFALLAALARAQTVPFTVTSPAPNAPMPEIVLQYDAETKSGADWATYAKLQWHAQGAAVPTLRAAHFLREGVQRMTGKELPIVSKNDLTRGLVLTTLDGAPAALRNDPEVQAALKNTGKDYYNDREAFFVRSEKDRVLVIANTPDGLSAGVVELLLSVGYEVLGMGPNWTYAPDYSKKPLVFNLKKAGRPSYYLRALWATSGQGYGVGTLMQTEHPGDEPVYTSAHRWMIGTRMAGKSMPGFPGHALQGYHKVVAEKMLETKTTDGFLARKCTIGPDNDRPAASDANKGDLWICTERDAKGALQAYLSDGKTWAKQNLSSFHVTLDLTVPLVRQVIFDAMKQRAEKSFADNPHDVFVFGTDAEDGGGNAQFAKLAKNPHWYPEYRKAIGAPLGAPYLLHGYNGINQPKEAWEPAMPSDTMFGFNDWLLREFDKYIDALPTEQRVTAGGKSKKELVRCSFYSYNFHDVPPSFNPDQRIRVMIAGYPKNRGRGKWKNFASQLDVAKAFQILLPREPSGDYRIISLAYYRDYGVLNNISWWSTSPTSIATDFKNTYSAGIKAMSVETDYNFGKFGLAYYLIAQMLWNAEMTPKELEAVRDRWLQKAYGSAWREMQAYYDFMVKENYPVNGPNAWAKAIRLIDAAQRKLDTVNEPAAQRRLDDLKQHWYFYYLQESGQANKESAAMREYIWKGQMSYMVAMHAVIRRIYETNKVAEIADPAHMKGPAQYTHAETQAWWAKVLDFWKYTPVTLFRDTKLANGKPAKDVNLDDLVAIKEFQGGPDEKPYAVNSYSVASTLLVTYAAKEGDRIGFKFLWPFIPERGEAYQARAVNYGVDYFNRATGAWDAIVDKTTTEVTSKEAKRADDKAVQYLEVSLPAPKPGLYRFDIGRGGYLANIASLGYDVATDTYATTTGFTFLDINSSLTQSPTFFYIPKGTKRLDFEVADTFKGKTIFLYTTLPGQGLKLSRKIECGALGTYTIELQPGEDGTVAECRANGLGFPFMYSIPGGMWAKSPRALMIPRAIAEADGLTIIE